MPEQPEKLDLTSMDVTEDKKQKLKQLFPEVFREDKIDFDHLKRVLGEWVPEKGRERFGLQWPGKAECMKIIQQPSVASLKPDREESVNFDDTENLFIEGDNLEVLKLLQKSYFGEVKVIYIDPPYNTGNEFVYSDDYGESLDKYLKYTDQKDGEGNWQTSNKETEGRYHSKWLNMMYPRLFLSKNLLREDGVVFISIDDNEVAHLRKLCDEIFGEENFVAQNVWQKRYSRENRGVIGDAHEYVVVYAKDLSKYKEVSNLAPVTDKQKEVYNNTNNDPRGPWRGIPMTAQGYRPNQMYEIETPSGKVHTPPEGRCWSMVESKFKKLREEGRIYFGKDGSAQPSVIRYLDEVEGVVPWTWWPHEETGHTDEARKEIKQILGKTAYYDTPKPVRLIKRILEISSDEDDIILDFFAGSGTTAQAILEMNREKNDNRKFIMVQLPEPTGEDSEARKEGFETIADIGKARIRKVSQRIEKEEQNQSSQKELELDEDSDREKELDLGFKVFELDRSNFKVWDSPEVDIDPDDLEEQLDVFADHISPEAEQESILYELILKSGYPLTTSIEEKEIEGKTIYSIQDDALLIYLDEGLTFEILDQMAEMEPSRVVCLDKSFSGEQADALKTNAVQLFKSHDIAFRTV